MKILLVDDEDSMRQLIGDMVRDAGYEFAYAPDGRAGVAAAQRERPDLVIMDVMLPVLDGFSSCRESRQRGIKAPIIFLSAKGDIVDKGVGFQAGGDDYLTKPFDPRELMMHIEAHLRRARMMSHPAAPMRDKVVHIGRLVLDSAKFQATKDGTPIPFTPKELKIVLALAAHPGVVLTREQLVDAVWGREFVGETSSITVFIKKIREKLEDDPSDPRMIKTVWGVGYRLDPEGCSEPDL